MMFFLPTFCFFFIVYDTTLGGIFHDNAFSWLSHGPRLEVFDVRKGDKVGAWTFGYVLKDLNTEIVCVEEIHRPNGRLPLLAVGLNCNHNGIVCIFDFARSKIIRAININEKVSWFNAIIYVSSDFFIDELSVEFSFIDE